MTPPLLFFPLPRSDGVHYRVKDTAVNQQVSSLNEFLQVLLVRHKLTPNLLQGRQIGEITEPAYLSIFAKTIDVNARLGFIFFVTEFGYLLCPLPRLREFPRSNLCASCPSNHIRSLLSSSPRLYAVSDLSELVLLLYFPCHSRNSALPISSEKPPKKVPRPPWRFHRGIFWKLHFITFSRCTPCRKK